MPPKVPGYPEAEGKVVQAEGVSTPYLPVRVQAHLHGRQGREVVMVAGMESNIVERDTHREIIFIMATLRTTPPAHLLHPPRIPAEQPLLFRSSPLWQGRQRRQQLQRLS